MTASLIGGKHRMRRSELDQGNSHTKCNLLSNPRFVFEAGEHETTRNLPLIQLPRHNSIPNMPPAAVHQNLPEPEPIPVILHLEAERI